MDLLPVISFAAVVWQHHRPEGEDLFFGELILVGFFKPVDLSFTRCVTEVSLHTISDAYLHL